METKSSKPTSIVKAKEILSNRSKEGELGYEQTQALENAEKFSKFKPDGIKKLVEKLTNNEKISEELATKIIDICPTDVSTLKAILVKDRIELSDEEINQIIKELS
jgi:DNA-directed RNA polymerase subunit F